MNYLFFQPQLQKCFCDAQATISKTNITIQSM